MRLHGGWKRDYIDYNIPHRPVGKYLWNRTVEFELHACAQFMTIHDIALSSVGGILVPFSGHTDRFSFSVSKPSAASCS